MKLLARIGAPFAWKVVRQHDGYTYFENSITGQRQLPLAMIQATSLLVALLVPISADARLGIPDALGVLRAAMIPFELPAPTETTASYRLWRPDARSSEAQP